MRAMSLALAFASPILASTAHAQSLDTLSRVREARSARASSAAPEDWSNRDNRWIKPGDTLTIADIGCPGVIRHIWLTFPESSPSWISSEGCADPSEIVLRMYWDGQDEPAVEAPLGDFFACGFGRRAEVNSVPVQVQGVAGDSYNCFWTMPFFKSARVTVTNESARPLAAFYYHVDYTRETPPPDSAYFCAQYRQEFPCNSGDDYLVADIEAPDGGGHYVGTVLSVRSRSPQWFGEGDDKFYFDGEAEPTIWGTGTEDYFLNAWGMERQSFPSFGVTQLDGWLGDLGDAGTMYRWHLEDPVRFTRSLRFVLEHKGWMSADETTTGLVNGHVERNDDFATVAFWYQRGKPKRFATLPSAAQRRLPAIDVVVQGKDLLPSAKAEMGAVSLQAGTLWIGDGQLFFDGQGVGASLEVTFNVPADRPRMLILSLTHSYDFGTYQVSLDGGPYGPPDDLYAPRVEVRPRAVGDAPLPPGSHTLRLECVSANPNSAGFKLGLDSIRLRERTGAKRPPLGPKPAPLPQR
ncbi:MAG: DUF2961 domain-containing protein [Phycisphaerae bacterium]|nr:DUF2961 domain-containing protein [Phycisphaerae bacterium]